MNQEICLLYLDSWVLIIRESIHVSASISYGIQTLDNKPLHSTSMKPDLDWSQVRETISMLTLAVAQIESTLRDGEKSVSELTDSFTSIAEKLQNISSISENIRQTNAASAEMADIIDGNTLDIGSKVSKAVVAFQFYDRLTQRLEHVKRDLNWLGQLIGKPSELYNPLAWQKLQQDIMQNYTMEEERLMFEHIMQGASVDEALEIYRHHFASNQQTKEQDDTGDDIELF